MGARLVPCVWLRLGRAACDLVVLSIVAALLSSCNFNESQSATPGNAPCSFGGLVLVPVVCVRAEPERHQDGTWTYPLSNPKIAGLHPGSILVVARKSVRRVESVRRTGDQVTLTTDAVPLTEVVKDGRIPLNASITPNSIERTVDQPPPPPPAEPPHTVSPTPSQSSTSPTPPSTSPTPRPPVTPVVSASVRTLSEVYQGSCSPDEPGQGPTFEATISVSDGPVAVAYHWTLTDPKGSTKSIPATLTFTGTGPQTQTADYSVPVAQYAPDTTNEGQISLQVDSPSIAAAPEHLPYQINCSPISPSTSTSTSTSVVGSGSRLVKDQSANLLANVVSVGGYQIQPSLTLSKDSFRIGVVASRQIGPATLTWEVHGELKDFLSGGALRIVNHQLRDSGLDTTRLRGQLRLDWSLSAAVPQAVLDRLSLDLPIRLFVQPLLVGDFPVFLAVEIHLHVGPEFTPGQALHGYTSISFSGSQGFHIHLRAIDRPRGPSIHGLRLDAGIKDLLRLPTLKAWVDFPYISLGDDFYSTGAWLWTSPRMAVNIAPGHNPGLCARAETDASASVGTEFQLFGLREALSTQIYDRSLRPTVSFPRNPECITG
jgi:hypothetical protein